MPTQIPYHRQLLDQAQELATKDAYRPTQANLRRAVSGSYYALFHMLVADSTRSLLGATQQSQRSRDVLARTYSHAEMAKSSKSFSGGWGALPESIKRCLPSGQVDPGVMLVAKTFAELQEERHRADYDLSDPFLRDEALELVQSARNAAEDWSRVKDTESALAFGYFMLVWSKLAQK